VSRRRLKIDLGPSSAVCAGLAVVFVALRLAGVVGWSWWWVLAPLWAPAAAGLAVLAVMLMLVGLGVWRGVRRL
jgi:hypothetical protein